MKRIPELTIDKDGPYLPDYHRRWLARQLMDSKLTDDEAYGIVAYHPSISDIWKRDSRCNNDRD